MIGRGFIYSDFHHLQHSKMVFCSRILETNPVNISPSRSSHVHFAQSELEEESHLKYYCIIVIYKF